MYKIILTILAVVFVACKPAEQVVCKTGALPPDTDQRTEVVEDGLPFRAICHLTVKRRWGAYPSTGFFISKNFIVTSGHSAGEWRWLFKNKIKEVKVVVFEHFEGENEYKVLSSRTYDASELTAYGAHENYHGKRRGSAPYDFGFIKLPDTTTVVNDIDQFFELRDPSAFLKSEAITMAGYPADKQKIKEGSFWEKHDQIENMELMPSYVTYSLYTYEGDSGAPLWVAIW